LYRLVSVIADVGAVVRSAVVGTLGAEAVDVFYLVDIDGKPLSDDAIDGIVTTIYAALAAG
jgi:[protein-PII] uridylyltransferase